MDTIAELLKEYKMHREDDEIKGDEDEFEFDLDADPEAKAGPEDPEMDMDDDDDDLDLDTDPEDDPNDLESRLDDLEDKMSEVLGKLAQVIAQSMDDEEDEFDADMGDDEEELDTDPEGGDDEMDLDVDDGDVDEYADNLPAAGNPDDSDYEVDGKFDIDTYGSRDSRRARRLRQRYKKMRLDELVGLVRQNLSMKNEDIIELFINTPR